MSTSVFHNGDRWLSLLQELLDPATTRRLEDVGVASGWHVLEVGAGRGSIAVWLAERVGDEGRVVATDIETSLLEELGDPRIEVLRHDVRADDFPPDSFDLIHCRSLLVHLGDPERALERMAGWLKPGGALVAEEPMPRLPTTRSARSSATRAQSCRSSRRSSASPMTSCRSASAGWSSVISAGFYGSMPWGFTLQLGGAKPGSASWPRSTRGSTTRALS